MASPEPAPSSTSASAFKKRAPQKAKLRKRPAAEDEGESSTSTSTATTHSVVRSSKSQRTSSSAANPLRLQSSSSSRHKSANNATTDKRDADLAFEKPSDFSYKASTTVVKENSDNGATRYAEWDTTTSTDDKDAQAVLDRHHRAIELEAAGGGVAAEGLYKGKEGYTEYIKKRDNGRVSNSKMKAGPIRAPANVRAISVIDYQPDVCKDYKQTGFCGYGDSCIFMHDRGDYKSGWQLEKEWEENGGKIGSSGKTDYEVNSDDSNDEELPFACFICKETYKRPVKTKCSHYFCEKCALAHYAKTNKCFICQAPTGGVFNAAKNLIAKLAERKEQSENKGSEDEEQSAEK